MPDNGQHKLPAEPVVTDVVTIEAVGGDELDTADDETGSWDQFETAQGVNNGALLVHSGGRSSEIVSSFSFLSSSLLLFPLLYFSPRSLLYCFFFPPFFTSFPSSLRRWVHNSRGQPGTKYFCSLPRCKR